MNMTKKKPEPTADEAPVRKHEHTDKVARNVLNALGMPPGFQKIRATNVYDNRWRVDVFQKSKGGEGMVTRTHICDSFFLTTDGSGNIEQEIIKKYE